jgi:molecular chaperone DnaK (HSP70)
LEQYIEQTKDAISNREKLANKLELKDKFKIREIISRAEVWLIANENKSNKDEMERQLKSIMKDCDPILAKYYK